MPIQDHYKILEVSKRCDPQGITAAYRRLALLHHPDRNPEPNSTAKFQKIQEAYEVLSDPVKKRDYDLETGAWRSRRERRPRNSHSHSHYRPANLSEEEMKRRAQEELREIFQRRRRRQFRPSPSYGPFAENPRS